MDVDTFMHENGDTLWSEEVEIKPNDERMPFGMRVDSPQFIDPDMHDN